ncbi:AAA family ATPase [Chloroflexota bacterium]
MAVVTISRQFGSGGRRIAGRVSEVLGYRYFDKALIIQAAAEVGLAEDHVIDHPEMHYEEKGLRERLWHALFGSSKMTIGSRDRPTLTWGGLEAQLDEDWLVAMVNETIQEAYRQGNVVIVGRGGQAVLQDQAGVLHVRVEAPTSTRLWRIHNYEGVTNVDEAKRLVETLDKRSAAYVQRFFNVTWDDPALYHLVINTGKLQPDVAVHLIEAAIKQMTLEAAPS